MLFQVVHTHTHETCPAVFPDRRKTLEETWRSLKGASDVRVVSAHAAPLDHVFHFTVESDDLASVVRAMAPLNALGTAVTSPVLPLDELLGLVGGQA